MKIIQREVILIFLSIFVLHISMLSKEPDFSTCKNLLISNVEINSNPKYREVFRKIVVLKEKTIFSPLLTNRSIKNIFAIEGVKDVEVLAKKSNNMCKIVFKISMFPLIRTFKIRGNSFFDEKTLRKNIYVLNEKVFFTPEYKRKIIKEFKNFYNKRGFFKPSFSVYVNREGICILNINAGPRMKIEKIVVEGNFIKGNEGKFVRDFILNRTKGIFDLEKLRESIDSLKREYLKSGYFLSSISWDYRLQDKGSIIILKIKKGKKVEVVVTGYKIKKIKINSVWNPYVSKNWAIEEGKNIILKELLKYGYMFPIIHYDILETRNEIKVKYEVIKGKRYKLGNIKVINNKKLSKILILEKIKPLIKDFYKYAYFDGSIMDEIVYVVEKTYWDMGFRDAEIKLTPVKRGKYVDIYIKIKEGDKTLIKDVELVGNNYFSSTFILKNMLNISLPMAYNMEKINSLKTIIEAFYQEKGFKDVRVVYEINEGLNGDKLVFKIFEGERYFIEDIIWIGERVIKEELFWDCVYVSKGKYLNFRDVEKTIKELSILEVFGNIKIKFLRKERGKYIMFIKTEEANTVFTSYGIGWKERAGLRGFIEFQKINPLGKANIVSFLLRYGKNDKRFIANFESPWKWEKKFKTFITLWYEDENLTSYSFKRRGFSFNALYKTDKNSYYSAVFKFLETELTSLSIPESEVDRENAPFSSSIFAFNYSFDGRNDPVNPTSGTYFSIDFSKAFKFLGTESSYIKGGIKFQHVRKIKEGFLLIEQVRMGIGGGEIPIVDRYFAGGSFSFRGAKVDYLGPIDSKTQKPLGGNAILVNNIELWIPSTLPVEGLFVTLFYDMGDVMKNLSVLKYLRLQHAIGIGVRYITPLGPIRVDISYNISENAYEKGPFIYFAIGNIF